MTTPHSSGSLAPSRSIALIFGWSRRNQSSCRSAATMRGSAAYEARSGGGEGRTVSQCSGTRLSGVLREERVQERRAASRQASEDERPPDLLRRDLRPMLAVLDQAEAVHEQTDRLLPRPHTPDEVQVCLGLVRADEKTERLVEGLVLGEVLQACPPSCVGAQRALVEIDDPEPKLVRDPGWPSSHAGRSIAAGATARFPPPTGPTRSGDPRLARWRHIEVCPCPAIGGSGDVGAVGLLRMGKGEDGGSGAVVGVHPSCELPRRCRGVARTREAPDARGARGRRERLPEVRHGVERARKAALRGRRIVARLDLDR